MLNKRRLFLITSLPLAVVVVLGVLAMLPARPGVTKANFDRIENGMGLPEIERMFGRASDRMPVPGNEHVLMFWTEDNGDVAIIEFLNDSVCSKQWEGGETVLDRIRRWLRLN